MSQALSGSEYGGGERVALECSQALISPFTSRPRGHSYISSDIPGGVRNGEKWESDQDYLNLTIANQTDCP